MAGVLSIPNSNSGVRVRDSVRVRVNVRVRVRVRRFGIRRTDIRQIEIRRNQIRRNEKEPDGCIVLRDITGCANAAGHKPESSKQHYS